jgi:GNAT superfamily N-acetyltransferase
MPSRVPLPLPAPLVYRATPAEAEECLAVLREFALREQRRLGTVSWAHPRVSAVVHADAAAGRLYAVRTGSTLVATFALCDEADPYFVDARWADRDASATYLHRLAVADGHRGSGVGTWCVGEAERIATAMGSAYLRLDALRDHERVLAFYARLHYADCGVVGVESGLPERPVVELACFEKRLPG